MTELITKPFAELGVSARLLAALNQVGYDQATPIQTQAIPPLIDGQDLLGLAQTGTGKTAAFLVPMIQRLLEVARSAQPRRPRALILAPTRELAAQIGDELQRLCSDKALSHCVIFGGVGQNPQVKALQKGLDVVVGTPGRLLDLMSQKHLYLDAVEVLVLDEADRLLDMGFVRDVKRIVAATPKQRQSLLFSATMPKEVAGLARELLREPVRIDVTPKERTVKKIDQRVVFVDNADKQRMLEKLLRDEAVTRAIVFTRTKHGANKVAKKLMAVGIGAEAIHGNKSQNARQRALASFKNGDVWVLVATDIAARGIDIDGVSHVFNQELPHEPESYVHRIGRTGRAGASGTAWSLVDPSEQSRLRAISRLIGFTPNQVEIELPPRTPQEEAALKESEAQRARSKAQGSNRSGGGRRSGRSGQARSARGNGNSSVQSSANDSNSSTPPKRRRRRRPKKVA